MFKLSGIMKVTAVLTADFLFLCSLLNDAAVAALVTGGIALYVWLGGYLSLFQDGAVACEKLPEYERNKLHAAGQRLIGDVRRASNVDLSGLKLYLIPGDDDLQATTYGANCISVAKGTLDAADPSTLAAVLGHEAAHILHADPEFNRAVFASVLLVCLVIGAASYAAAVIIFLLFLCFGCLNSWLGIMAYKGTNSFIGGTFRFFQKGIIVLYRAVICWLSRAAEYRSDRYAASLAPSYALQLANFLSYAAIESNRQLTLTEALYRTHPATPKRIARLEAYVSNETYLELKK